MARGPLEVARAALQAYEDKDRAAIESLLAEEYRFTSPLDNGLDRECYLAMCWPHSADFSGHQVVHAAENGDVALMVYEVTIAGKRLRNCEAHTVREGKLVATEVYFGWDVPHAVAAGTHEDR